jgi:hypothetical protein
VSDFFGGKFSYCTTFLPSAVLTCLPPAELVTFLSDQVAALRVAQDDVNNSHKPQKELAKMTSPFGSSWP